MARELRQGPVGGGVGRGCSPDGDRYLLPTEHRRDPGADLRLRGDYVMIYSCCNQNRKSAVLKNPILNGIDYLEVLDHDAIALDSPRQQTLLIHCLKTVPVTLKPANVIIAGGESVTGIVAVWVAPASAPPTAQTNFKEQAYFESLRAAAGQRFRAGGGGSVRGDGGADGIRSSPGRGTILIQSGMRYEFRLRPSASRLSSGDAHGAANQLPGQRLRQFPHPDPGSVEPTSARLGRRQRS